jgi:hypothetical protein
MTKYRLTQVPLRVAVLDTRAVRPPPKVVDAFYVSAEWRALVARLVRERGRVCEACGCSEAGGPVRLYGDHIRALKDGGAPLDPHNVRLLCPFCHGQKTAAERARRLVRPPGSAS